MIEDSFSEITQLPDQAMYRREENQSKKRTWKKTFGDFCNQRIVLNVDLNVVLTDNALKHLQCNIPNL